MLKITYEDQEYEFVGYLTHPGTMGATHYLAYDGSIKVSNAIVDRGTAHFRLVTVRHTFGGIVFEEIGKERQARKHEWGLGRLGPICFSSLTGGKYKILRPVEIEHA